jgi:hypothetical protein
VLSGVPSTVWAFSRGEDPLAATRAAGRLLLPGATDPGPLFASAAAAHGALSLWWTAVLSRLPGGPLRAAGYGAAIAALDLGIAHAVRGRRFGPTADLAVLPQLADHLAFAVIARSALGQPVIGRGRARPSAARAGR